MIKFGVAGIPLTSKGRTYIDSIIDVLNLGLNALEVQLLRVNVNDTPATEYAGMYPKDVEDSIIVDVLRPDENGNYQSVGVETEIEEDDIVQELFWNMARNYNELYEGMELAKELDVDISIHAPYYMDMLSDDEMAEKSISHLKWAIIIGKAMGAKRVITHTGFYHAGREESMSRAISIYSDILKAYPRSKGYPYIGVEATSKSDIFGTVEELLYLAKSVNGIEPILNFPHIHSVTNGSLIEPSNFSELIERFLPYAHGDLYTEFAGVDYENGNEVKITAIKHGDLKFETLAEVLSVFDNEMTIISMSPLLEHDAQYMQLMYMRSLLKKYQKKSVKR